MGSECREASYFQLAGFHSIVTELVAGLKMLDKVVDKGKCRQVFSVSYLYSHFLSLLRSSERGEDKRHDTNLQRDRIAS